MSSAGRLAFGSRLSAWTPSFALSPNEVSSGAEPERSELSAKLAEPERSELSAKLGGLSSLLRRSLSLYSVGSSLLTTLTLPALSSSSSDRTEPTTNGALNVVNYVNSTYLKLFEL